LPKESKKNLVKKTRKGKMLPHFYPIAERLKRFTNNLLAKRK
jgi:hypothetical protein